jgi:excisionase family DNA binding protein
MENSILIRNLTVEELQNLMRLTIKEELQVVLSKKEDPKYLTRKEACAFLKISLPTLNQYTRTGRINGYRIGRRVLYNLEDLELNMEEILVSR